jgi:hypothetical protein
MTLIFFHMQGVTLRDALIFSGQELQRLAAALEQARLVETRT